MRMPYMWGIWADFTTDGESVELAQRKVLFEGIGMKVHIESI